MAEIVRDVPEDVQLEINQQESAEFYLAFVRISSPELSEPICIVSDPEDFILRNRETGEDETYVGFTFDVTLLTDSEDMPKASLSVQNVSKIVGQGVLAALEAPRLDLFVIAGSQFDVQQFPRVAYDPANVEYMMDAPYLYLIDVKGDPMFISGTIRSWDYTQESYPSMRATENRFPGLFW